MSIKISAKGSYAKANTFLQKLLDIGDMSIADKYGKRGVAALEEATPRDSGKTAESWSYKVVRRNSGFSIEFHNDNVVDGVPIALVIQYGHGTNNGGYVQGRDYINPALIPIFEEMAEEIAGEVRNA